MVAILIIFFIIVLPVLVLTFFNIFQLCKKSSKKWALITVEAVGILLGAFYSYLQLTTVDIYFDAMWYTEIPELYKYPPYDITSTYQIYIVLFIGLLGWAYLRICPLEKQTPLGTVIALSAFYIFIADLVLYMIQIWGVDSWFIVLIYPINVFIILIKLIKEQIAFRKDNPVKSKFSVIQKIISRAYSLPIIAFVLSAAFIGLLMLILILFGQEPDEIIKVWTNTAEWTFSQRTPPPKTPYDGHYLCTVAANGHQKLVKPLRTGKRNGHIVLVNRQLMIANAFEDLIKERTPAFHRIIRNFYDKTGFPISKYIGTKLRSDAVYIVMKPLEWIFLAVLYLFDTKPENRIAIQYMG